MMIIRFYENPFMPFAACTANLITFFERSQFSLVLFSSLSKKVQIDTNDYFVSKSLKCFAHTHKPTPNAVRLSTRNEPQ